MKSQNFYTGTFGFELVLKLNHDLSRSEDFRIVVRNPKNNTTERFLQHNCVLSPPSDGKIVYKTQKNDFPTPGTYLLQAFDETGGDKRIGGDILEIEVLPSVEHKGT